MGGERKVRQSVRKINGGTIKQNSVSQTISLINFTPYIISVWLHAGL